jgi:mannose-6-phosphate isomerase-like protein (cupin superfamily)
MLADTVELLSAAQGLQEYWSPRIVARVNDQFVKVAKLRGEFVWHCHEHEDELFLVLRGELKIRYENDRTITLGAGSLHVVPRGVMHNPLAEEECWIALIETISTKHTGELETPRTKSIGEQH